MRYHDRLLAVIFCALALVGGAARAEDRALVIGINAYPGLDEESQLKGAVTDANNFAGMLVSTLGYRRDAVKVLTDAEATKGGILAAFQEWLVNGTKPGDRVVFYYAGHGNKEMVSDGSGGSRPTSTLVVANYATPGVTGLDGVVLGSEIGKLIEKLDGRDVLVVADSCHSGSVTRGIATRSIDGKGATARTITPRIPHGMDPAAVTPAFIVENQTEGRFLDTRGLGGGHTIRVAVWSAVTLAQVAMENGGSGIFTTAFVDGLKGAAAPGPGKPITASHLLDYVTEVSVDYCNSLGKDECPDGLTPELIAPDGYRARILSPYAADQPAIADDTTTTSVLEPEQPTQVADSSPEPTPSSEPIANTSSESLTSTEPVADTSSEPTISEASIEPPMGDDPDVAPEPTAPELVLLAEDMMGHSNDFEVSASVLPSPYVKLGQDVQFRIESAEAGELVVFDAGPDGVLRRIFPNQYSQVEGRKASIRANAPLTIPDASYPFSFVATDVGPSSLIVLVAEPGTNLDSLLGDAPFEPVTNADRALASMAATLQSPLLSSDPGVPNRARRWAFALVPYDIAE
jgi:hypothetical protein